MPRAAPWMLTCLALSALACAATGPQFTAQDEAAIRAEFEASIKDVQAGNWDAWAALYADDAVLQPPNAPAVRGHAALLSWGRAFPPVESASEANLQIHGDGNLAWATTDWSLQIKGMPADHGKELIVLKRGADGKWMVEAGSFSSDVPLPAPAPAPKRK